MTEPCESCAMKDKVIQQLGQTVAAFAAAAQPYRINTTNPVALTDDPMDFYDQCPCNPKNGGSGICHCIRGSGAVIR